MIAVLAPLAVEIPIERLGSADTYVLILLTILGAISCVGLYNACRISRFNLFASHWTFFLVFFVFAPTMQVVWNAFPVQAIITQAEPFTFRSIEFLIVWASIVLTYQLRMLPKGNMIEEPAAFPKIGALRALILSASSFIVLLGVVGFQGLLSRAESSSEVTSDNSPLLIPVFTTGRAIPAICAILLISHWKHLNRAEQTITCVVTILAVLSNFPLGIARFWLGGLVIGVIALSVRHRLRSGLWLPAALMLSFVIVLPFLNNFRGSRTVEEMAVARTDVAGVASTLTSSDFDAFTMMRNNTWYVDHNYPSMGWHMFGNLLFFVPRSVWPEKPGASSAPLFEVSSLGKINNNLSQPLTAEFLMNFGVLGIPAGAFFFAYLARKLDQNYRSPSKSNRSLALGFSYPFLTGFLIFILRGSLLSSLAYTCGFIGAVYLSLVICRKPPQRPQDGPSNRFTHHKHNSSAKQ